jgi:hypothetical protein
MAESAGSKNPAHARSFNGTKSDHGKKNPLDNQLKAQAALAVRLQASLYSVSLAGFRFAGAVGGPNVCQ